MPKCTSKILTTITTTKYYLAYTNDTVGFWNCVLC